MIDIAMGPYGCPFRAWTPGQGRVFDGLFAYDTETTLIDDDRPYLVPSLVLATACDGHRGRLRPPRPGPGVLRGPRRAWASSPTTPPST